MKKVASLVLVLAVIVLAIWTWHRHETRSIAGAADATPAVAVQSAPAGDETLPARRDNRAEPGDMPTMEQVRQLAKLRVERYQELAAANADFRKQMAARYEGEKANAAWASATESRIASVLAELQRSDPSVTGDVQAHCKATICKIDASFPSQAQADTWVSMLMPMLGGVLNKAVVSRHEEAGGIGIVIYGSEH